MFDKEREIELGTCEACLNQMFCKYIEEFETMQDKFKREMALFNVDSVGMRKIDDVPYLIMPELKCRYYRERHAIVTKVTQDV